MLIGGETYAVHVATTYTTMKRTSDGPETSSAFSRSSTHEFCNSHNRGNSLPNGSVETPGTHLLIVGVKTQRCNARLVDTTESTQKPAISHAPDFDRSLQVAGRQKLGIPAERQTQHTLRMRHELLLSHFRSKRILLPSGKPTRFESRLSLDPRPRSAHRRFPSRNTDRSETRMQLLRNCPSGTG